MKWEKIPEFNIHIVKSPIKGDRAILKIDFITSSPNRKGQCWMVHILGLRIMTVEGDLFQLEKVKSLAEEALKNRIEKIQAL